MTDQHLPDVALDPDAPASTTERPVPTLAEAIGGPRGLIDSGLPTLAFVVANTLSDLDTAIRAAIAVGIVLMLIRVVRREVVRHTISGFFGLLIAVMIARATGSARGFFIPGIAMNGAYFVLCVGSLALRRPVIGVILRQLSDKPREWHEQREVRRAYAEVTVLWAAMFGLRLIVQGLLYVADEPGWLAAAKLGLGYPLYIPVLAATPLWVKRRTAGLPDLASGATVRTPGEDAAGDVSS